MPRNNRSTNRRLDEAGFGGGSDRASDTRKKQRQQFTSIEEFIAGAPAEDVQEFAANNPAFSGGIGGVNAGRTKVDNRFRSELLRNVNRGQKPTIGPTGQGKGGGELLDSISELAGGNVPGLAGAIQGAKSGFGSIGVTFRRKGFASTPLLDFKNTDPRDIIKVPAGPAGSFELFPSAGTKELGEGIITQFRRSQDIKQRRDRKKKLAGKARVDRSRGKRPRRG